MPQMPENVRFDYDGSLFYDRDKNSFLLDGNPLVKMVSDKGTEMEARTARVDLNDKCVYLNGDVSIFQGPSVTRGEAAQFYWETEELKTESLRSKVNSFLLESGKFVVKKDEKGLVYYEGKDAGVTLQDIDTPDSWLRASRIRLYPEDRVVFNHMTVYADEYPIFYFPYFSHSLNPRLGYLPTPGARSIWGGFLKNEYGFVLGERYVESGIPTGDYIGIARYDYRTRRGSAVGFDVIDTRMEKEAPAFSGLSLYYADDLDPGIRLEGIPREKVTSDRWRVVLQERVHLNRPEGEGWWWRADANFNVLSDRYMLADFFPTIVMQDQTPDNTLSVVGVKESHVLTTTFRAAPNDFYLVDQRYPELTWDRVRGTVFDSPFTYEGTASFSVIEQYLPSAEKATARQILSYLPEGDPRRKEYQAYLSTQPFSRFNTYHEFSRPETYGGFLTITPRMGGGYTGYYDVQDVGNYNRGLFFGGVDFNVKIMGDFDAARSAFWGINTLRHVVEPYVNYSYVSTNALDPMIPQANSLNASTNPLPLSVGRYTALDSLKSWNTARLGVRNLLLTKRGRAVHEWMSWDIFTDAYLNDMGEEEQFSNMYSRVSWNPKPWVGFGMLNQFPVMSSGSGYQEHNFSSTFMPCRSLEIILTNYNLINHPLLDDSNMLGAGFNVRLSESSSLSAVYRWELNDSTLERQEYSYFRNLGSWVIGIGYYQTYNRIQYDRGIMVTFSLKDYPSTRFPFKF